MDVRLPDGTVIKNVPEGTTRAQLAAKLGRAKIPIETPDFEQEAARIASVTPAEILMGSAPGRFAMGAASPFIGAAQLASNLIGFGGTANAIVSRADEMRRRGMEAQPNALLDSVSPDFMQNADAAGLAGTLVSAPAAAAMKVPMAATAGARAGQGAVIGAGLGASSPVTNADDFWLEKAAQTGLGAGVGAALPSAIDAVRKGAGVVRNVVDPMLPGGIDRAVARTANAAAGPKRAEVIAALQRARELTPGSSPTAGQAAADAGSAEFAGLQRVIQGRQPTAYNDIAQSQEVARQAAIKQIAGDDELLDAAIALRRANADAGYGAVAGNRIDPRAETQIMQDAIQARFASKASALQDEGRFGTLAAQAGANIDKSVAKGTKGLTADDYREFPILARERPEIGNLTDRIPEARAAATETGAIANVRQKEMEFLDRTMGLLKETVGLDERALSSFLSRPSIREAVKDAARSADEVGSYFPRRADDKFSVANLQRIKESLDEGIKAAKSSTDAGKRPDLSVKELEGTRKAFVDWLSNRSPEWKAARLQYAEDSLPINRMQVGAELQKALRTSLGTGERPATFANAVENAPKTIKRATGSARFDELGQVLTPKEMASVRGVVADLARDKRFDDLGKIGAEQARKLIGDLDPGRLPNALHRPIMIMNAVLNRMKGRVEGRSMDRLAELMQSPKEMARIMEKATQLERNVFLESTLIPRAARTATVGAALIGGSEIGQ